MIRQKISRSNATWLALALVTILATVLFARHRITEPRTGVHDLRTVPNWANYAEAGILAGDSLAPVRIVEFFDFECRFCRSLQPKLVELVLRLPRTIAVVYRHFPMSAVGFAIPAAIAAECAAEQGRFEPFAALLYESQDTLARLALGKVALRAGVKDTVQFNVCRASAPAIARVNEDINAGRLLGIVGTPALLVGDQFVTGDLPLQALENIVRRVTARQLARSSTVR